MDSAAKAAIKVRFYRPRNALKEKLKGGNQSSGHAVDDGILARAQAAMEKMSEDYPDWVGANVAELRTLLARCVDTNDQRRRHFDAIRLVAHEMKGQGGTFGYPLISTFASSLMETCSPSSPLSDANVEIVKSHVDAMAAVIKDRMKGSGGEMGKELASQLKAAIEKHSKI
jgi:chemotaxis protein histidine kinase CheA